MTESGTGGLDLAPNDRVSGEDLAFLERAVELGRRGWGRVSPNPMVGCVVVQKGEVVGEGWHRELGGPHAEVHALAEAGESARGATAYTSLEPCAHTGRTPPCTGALLDAAITRVVFAAAGPGAGGPDFFRNHDLHIHVPAGSVPKDGPSAGVTIAAAIVSVCSGRMIDHRVAMTGEITLRGEVLPVGGLKEKLLAARGAGIRKVVLPERNRRDLPEIPGAVTRGLELLFVEHVDQVLEAALLDPEHQRSWPAAKTG